MPSVPANQQLSCFHLLHPFVVYLKVQCLRPQGANAYPCIIGWAPPPILCIRPPAYVAELVVRKIQLLLGSDGACGKVCDQLATHEREALTDAFSFVVYPLLMVS
jgi:hypothetical protein